MTRIIGLTGGIGSGKTTIARLFESWGVPVYIADDAAKKVMQKPDILKMLSSEFGHDIIQNGMLNRPALAAKVFADAVKLQKLNSMVHPAVRADFQDWLATKLDAPFVIKEAAILFESGSYLDCDAIITISAPIEIRLNRVINRDNTTREQILTRVNNQWTDAEREAKSDYIIHNIDLQQAEQQAYNVFTELTNDK